MNVEVTDEEMERRRYAMTVWFVFGVIVGVLMVGIAVVYVSDDKKPAIDNTNPVLISLNGCQVTPHLIHSTQIDGRTAAHFYAKIGALHDGGPEQEPLK